MPPGSAPSTWAAGAGATDLRQVALVADWCDPVMSAADRTRIHGKLLKVPAPKTLADARNSALAASCSPKRSPTWPRKP